MKMHRPHNPTEPGSTDRAKMPGGRPGFSLGNLRTFDSFRSPAYRYFFLGMVGQWGSMNMQMATNSLLVYRITGSAAILGLLSLASALPMLLLALFGGVVADRFPKKSLIQVSQIALAVLALSVAITLHVGYLSPAHPESWWVLMVNSVLQGTIMALAMPARQAIIPELVGKEQLMNAISLNMMGMNIFRLMAPAVAGILIDALGFGAVFYIMTGLYVMAIIFTLFLPVTGKVSVSSHSVLVDIINGLKYIRGNTTLLFVLVFSAISILFSMPYMFLLPVITDSILKVGATGLGVLMSVSGIGALVASLALASLPGRRQGITLLVANLVLSLSLIAFSFSRFWPASLGLMVFIGMGQTVHNTVATALFQTYSDSKYLGRVMSVAMMNFGLGSLGTFLAGVLAEAVGAPWAIGGFASVLILLVICVLLFVPRIRKLD